MRKSGKGAFFKGLNEKNCSSYTKTTGQKHARPICRHYAAVMKMVNKDDVFWCAGVSCLFVCLFCLYVCLLLFFICFVLFFDSRDVYSNFVEKRNLSP